MTDTDAKWKAMLERERGQPVDESRGEWRCNCPPDPKFDTSVNPAYVARCDKCGASRPAPTGGGK